MNSLYCIKQIENYEIELDSNLGWGKFGEVKKSHKIGEENKTLACKIIARE